MREYDETRAQIRTLKQASDRAYEEYVARIGEWAALLTRRFVDVGWSDTGSWLTHVCVIDPRGNMHKWFLCDPSRADACLKALAKVEKTAKATKEVK